MHMGPGPIDLFSTRFANMFTKEATGVVAGVQVDKEGLKQSLLALQKQWNPETAQFVASEPTSSEFQVSRSPDDEEMPRIPIASCYRRRPSSLGRRSRLQRMPL